LILWHLGMTPLIVRYVFRDPAMDLRWVLVGSILPDVIDKPIASILFHDTFRTHRIVGHALVFPVALLAVVMIATRRGTLRRRAWIALVIGVFIHLVLDGAWTSPEAFLWPFFGFDFPPVSGTSFGRLLADMVRSPWVWLGEAAGLAYIAYIWRRYLSGPGALERFARDGRIPLS
jgi:inner membrane protein